MAAISDQDSRRPVEFRTQGEKVKAPRKKPRAAGSRGAAAHRKDGRVAWLFIAPALIGFLVFFAYPMVRGIYLSFTEFHVLSPARWVGLANYRELLDDEVFWNSLRVTVYFVVLSVAIGILLSLVTAVILHRLTRSTVIRDSSCCRS